MTGTVCRSIGLARFYTVLHALVNCRLRDRIYPTSRVHQAPLTPICHVRNRLKRKNSPVGMQAPVSRTTNTLNKIQKMNSVRTFLNHSEEHSGAPATLSEHSWKIQNIQCERVPFRYFRVPLRCAVARREASRREPSCSQSRR